MNLAHISKISLYSLWTTWHGGMESWRNNLCCLRGLFISFQWSYRVKMIPLWLKYLFGFNKLSDTILDNNMKVSSHNKPIVKILYVSYKEWSLFINSSMWNSQYLIHVDNIVRLEICVNKISFSVGSQHCPNGHSDIQFSVA